MSTTEDLWAHVEWAMQHGSETDRITALMAARAHHRDVCAERDEARAVAQDLRHKLARARGAMCLTRHGFAITDDALDETACTDPPAWLVEEGEG